MKMLPTPKPEPPNRSQLEIERIAARQEREDTAVCQVSEASDSPDETRVPYLDVSAAMDKADPAYLLGRL